MPKSQDFGIFIAKKKFYETRFIKFLSIPLFIDVSNDSTNYFYALIQKPLYLNRINYPLKLVSRNFLRQISFK